MRATRIVATLAAAGEIQPASTAPGFFHDCLLAASAREHGFAILTWNIGDFELIARAEPELKYNAPFP